MEYITGFMAGIIIYHMYSQYKKKQYINKKYGKK